MHFFAYLQVICEPVFNVSMLVIFLLFELAMQKRQLRETLICYELRHMNEASNEKPLSDNCSSASKFMKVWLSHDED